MEDKRSLHNSKECFKKYDQAARSTIGTDCEIPSRKDCGIDRQRTERPTMTCSAHLEKTISQKNILIFKTLFIIGISFVASVVNFSRLPDFEKEQLYLETILITALYYLLSSDAPKSAALLLGGLFHWFLAFKTRRQYLTAFIMTCLQAIFESLRYYEWITMAEHIFFSCIAIHFKDFLKTDYVYMLIPSLFPAYFYYLKDYGIYLEDYFLIDIVLIATSFVTTGDLQYCYFQLNLSLLIVWVLLREIRKATSYSGLGFLMTELYNL